MRLLLFWILFVFVAEAQSAKSPGDLMKDLFQNYNKDVLPIKHAGDIVPLNISMKPINLVEIDEEKELLIMDTWIYMGWQDSYLSWDPTSYDGIQNLNVPSSKVWIPDISVYTSSPDVKLLPITKTNVIVDHGGKVIWVPPFTIHSICPMDLSDYPSDVQNCTVKLGSWTFGSKSVDLLSESRKVDLQYFEKGNPQWTIESSSVIKNDKYYDCCPDEYYSTLEYTFVLKRKACISVHIADNVCCFAVFLALLMFWMNPATTHKIVLGILAELILALDALYLGGIVNTPGARLRANEYVNSFMCMVGVFLVVELMIINIAQTSSSYKAPEWLLIAAKGFCQPFQLCLSRLGPSTATMNEEGAKRKSDEDQENHWKVVCMALDRVSFVVAFVLVILFYNVL